MPKISKVLQQAGTGLDAFGQVYSGFVANSMAKWNAREIEETSELNASLIEETAKANAGVLDFNSKVAEAQARDAIRRGFTDEERYAVSGRQLQGSNRAGYAAQGISLASGSPLDVEGDVRFTLKKDLLTIRVNAAREAWGYRVESESIEMQRQALLKTSKLEAAATRRVGKYQAESARRMGANARNEGILGAASTILGAAFPGGG